MGISSGELVEKVAQVRTSKTAAQPRQKWGDSSPQSLILVRDKLCVPYGFVYVFGARDLVKIGMTAHSVYRRWHGIKTANPWLERPLYVSGPLLARVIEIERACHAALTQYHVTGEWFNCPRELAIETVKKLEVPHE